MLDAIVCEVDLGSLPPALQPFHYASGPGETGELHRCRCCVVYYDVLAVSELERDKPAPVRCGWLPRLSPQRAHQC